jgi:polar amino acid transport system substrate-binding protein
MKSTYQFLFSRIILLLSPAIMFSAYSLSSENSLQFVINAPGSSPYLYFDNEGSRYQGVVVDFFESFDKSNAFNVQYVDSSRARNEKLVFTKVADLLFGSSVWVDNPQRFIYSDTIMPHVSFIYAVQKFENPFSLETHNRALICTRHDFTYPYLQPYFNEYKLVRVDSSSQTTMANILSKGQCDFAIMSKENARAVMFDNDFCANEFYQSPMPVTIDELSFIMGKHLTEARDKINQQIAVFINSGDRDKSIQKHIRPHTFPKRVCEQTADTGLPAED